MKKSNTSRVKENGLSGEFLGVYTYRLKSPDIRTKPATDARIMATMKRFWLDVVGIKLDTASTLDAPFDGSPLSMQVSSNLRTLESNCV